MNGRPAENTNPMTVLMTSTSYPANLSDWRALFIRHLVDALARREDIRLRLWSPPGEIPARATLDVTPAERRWLEGLMQAGGIAHLLRNGGLRGLSAPVELLRHLRNAYRRNADASLYHANWLQSALAMPRNNRPLLITALGTDMQLLKLPLMRSALRNRLKGHPVAICPNADWMVAPLQRAFGDIAKVVFVPFGIDPHWYAIHRDPGQPGPAKWLVVSRLTKAKLGSLFEWCQPHFEGQTRELHLFGPMQERVTLPAWVHYHGPATPEGLCNDWFPGATGLITLSQHAEGRPQVMLEAMAASLPIIASPLPAHEDIVAHRGTGWVCRAADQLAEALSTLEAPRTNLEYGLRAREWAATHVGTWDDCAQRYVTLYRELTAEALA